MTAIAQTTLWIPPKIYAELMFYAWTVDAEVGGVGTLEFNCPEPNDIYVTEVFLEKQKVHGTECLLSKDDSTYEKLILSNEIEKACKLQLWWHSHHTMGAGHSTTDDTTMREWSGEYVVALVINRKGDLKAKLMTKIPVMVVGDIEVRINWLDIEAGEEMGAEVAAKVTKEAPQAVVTYCGNYAQQQWQQVSGEYEHDKQTGLWGKKKKDDEATPLHSMTEAEWVEMEEEYYELLDDKDIKTLGFPVGEMDADEKRALKQIWDAKECD
jgi:hypothetical protein